MLEREEAIARMNELGARGIPFFFFTDFLGHRCLIQPLDEINPSVLRFAILQPAAKDRAHHRHHRHAQAQFHGPFRYGGADQLWQLLPGEPHFQNAHRNQPHTCRHLRTQQGQIQTPLSRPVCGFFSRNFRENSRWAHLQLPHERNDRRFPAQCRGANPQRPEKKRPSM